MKKSLVFPWLINKGNISFTLQEQYMIGNTWWINFVWHEQSLRPNFSKTTCTVSRSVFRAVSSIWDVISAKIVNVCRLKSEKLFSRKAPSYKFGSVLNTFWSLQTWCSFHKAKLNYIKSTVPIFHGAP